MNDYWNDPPEGFDPPMCKKCLEFMESADNWLTAKCPECGEAWAPPPDIDMSPPEEKPWTDDSERMVPMGDKCPHGNEWFSCDACDHASDLAYDAAREKRFK